MKTHTFPPRTILLPTDLGEASAAAFAFARLFHDQFGGSFHVLHAQYLEMPPYFSSGQLGALKRELDRTRRLTSVHLAGAAQSRIGAEVKVTIADKPAVAAILEAAEEFDADLILMGTHGRRGAERMWLGSVAERVLRESPRPVMAVHATTRPEGFRRLLCPISDSAAARAALEYAGRIAEASGARLSVLHAAEPGAPAMECPLVGDDLRRLCQVEERVVHGDAAAAILEAAQEHKPDLVVMGADRKPSFFGELFSSTTQKVMQAATAPILVVPRI